MKAKLIDGKTCLLYTSSFSPEDALYEGSAGKILTAVRVFVPAQGNAKVIDVSLENQTDEEAEVICAYGLEPVLGVTRLNAKYTQFDQEQGCLLMHNPLSLIHIYKQGPAGKPIKCNPLNNRYTYV